MRELTINNSFAILAVPEVIDESIKGIKRNEGKKDRRREYARRALAVLVENQVVIQEALLLGRRRKALKILEGTQMST
jgi:hypothetical protein